MRLFKRHHTGKPQQVLAHNSPDPIRDPKFAWKRAMSENPETILQLLRSDELSLEEMALFRQVEKSWVDRDATIRFARELIGLPMVHPLADPTSPWVKSNQIGARRGTDLSA